jgi:uncharacterized membrane protein
MMHTVWKTLTYGTGATLITVGIVYAFTGSWPASTAVAFLDRVVKVFWYATHEYLWERV